MTDKPNLVAADVAAFLRSLSITDKQRLNREMVGIMGENGTLPGGSPSMVERSTSVIAELIQERLADGPIESDAYDRTGGRSDCGPCGGTGVEYGETCVTCGGFGWVRSA